MDGGTVGLIGGIAGSVLGIAGGAVGTYFSIKNTNSPRERAFMIRCAVIWWIALTLFIGLMVLLPSPYRFLLWIPYGVLLPIGIITTNRRQQRIREEEGERAGL